jgi:hypothetical protein
MRRFRWMAGCLIALTVGVMPVRAEKPPSPQPSPPKGGEGRVRENPLRLFPEQTDLLIQAARPRRLVETLLTLDTFKQLQQVAQVRELLDSTNARRFAQLVAYFEKELDAPWPQLLDRLAGRGIVLGIRFGSDPAHVLLVIEGDDDKLMRQFFELGLRIVEQELARKEAKGKPIKGSYEGIDTVRLGDFQAAVAGTALLVSNSETTFHAALDRQRGAVKKSMADVRAVAEADKLLPPQPLASLWLSMKEPHKSPQFKAAYQPAPRDDPFQTVLFGPYLNLLGRTPFVCAGVYRDKDGFVTTIRMPRGRDGMGADTLLQIPPSGAPGSRPLLEPKNVLYSDSGYFDLANLWKERAKLFNDKQVQQLEKLEKQSAPFLAGAKLSKLLTQAGPYYRFVAAHQSRYRYKTTPKISIPAFALVWELREPQAFGKSMETILRGAALLAGARANLKLVEENYKDCKLVGYRFPEEQPLKGDVNDFRFNFTPCFTRVGDQFVVSSTMGLCRELVDLIQKEGTAPTRGDASTGRARLYGSGGAAYLQTIEDLLIAQIALDQALTPSEARRQVKTFLDVIRGLGALSLEPRFHDKTFQYDIRLRPEK